MTDKNVNFEQKEEFDNWKDSWEHQAKQIYGFIDKMCEDKILIHLKEGKLTLSFKYEEFFKKKNN